LAKFFPLGGEKLNSERSRDYSKFWV